MVTSGEQFHWLTASHPDPDHRQRWFFRCRCGTEKSIRRISVERGVTKSCGCLRSSATGRTSVQPGQKFGMLTVESRHSASRNGHIKWTCLCDCGARKDILGTHLKSGKTKTCGCVRWRTGPRHVQWTGCGEISGDYFNQLKRGADGSKGRRTLPFEVSIEYLWELFVSQGKKCSLTELPLTFRRKTHDEPQTASLDRIDSLKGYVEGNVQWVHKDINLMKGRLDQARFIKLCRLVTQARQ